MPVPCVATRAGRRRGGGAEAEEEEDEGAAAVAEAEAAATTPLIRAACAGPEGAVRLEDLPSCPTAEATSRASGEMPEEEEEEEEAEASEASSATEEEEASPSLQSTAARTPSPLPYPSADASKVLHLPSGERACSPEMVQVVIGSSRALTPPTTAASASKLLLPPEKEEEGEEFSPVPLPPPLPVVSALNARCAATSDAEHAVSVATQGPCSPNANETRPQRYEMPFPVAAAGEADEPLSPASYWSWACSWNIEPVKTAVRERTTGEEKKEEEEEVEAEDGEEEEEETERSAEPAASRRCLHCGSVAAASAGESPKAAESNSSIASTRAAHRA